MLFRLFVLFIIVPFCELALLLYLAEKTSWLFTLSVVVVTGVVGSLLAKSQGLRTYQRIQSELARGHMPTDAMIDGVMIFVAGALLLTPGILTDAFGMSLLVPFCRRFYRARISIWIKRHFTVETHRSAHWDASGRSEVIDSYVVPSDEAEPGRVDGPKDEAQ